MTSATKTTSMRRRSLRLVPVLAVLTGATAWAQSTSAQTAPPATMVFTVTPDEFVADGTFTVTIEGTGCVDPDGPAEAPLTAVFWLKGGAIGSDGNDLVIGVYEAEADGSYAGSSEVVTTFSDRGPITTNGEGLIEGFCSRHWPAPDPSDLVAVGQRQITVLAPPTDETTTSTAPATTEPPDPVVTTPPAPAPSAQPVAAAPAYTG